MDKTKNDYECDIKKIRTNDKINRILTNHMEFIIKKIKHSKEILKYLIIARHLRFLEK